MEQFEQLLTCAICLDRYRNPKLLPCQHSFCMEPCMDGLVDYVRRQVKCPECRAEHRIPYQGVQGYPTNVTLQRFLELHIEITGELPDPTSGQVMKRCNVCSEKAYCTHCVHCDKEVCPDCKGAHMDILRREISRINNQIRRALHRLQDMLAIVEKNMLSLQTNCTSVSEEVDEIYRRLNKALKDRTEYLRTEIDRYLSTEVRNLATLKDNLETEISNISANCDLADKHMQSEDIEWDDCELMDAKEIFLKTVDFIRNFESEACDYNRKVRFVMAHDPNQLVMHVAGYGDLTMNIPHQSFTGSQGQGSSGMLQTPGPGLMRSKSDHRLASQFRQQEERGYERGYEGEGGRASSPLGGRKFGEGRRNTDRYEGRYGRGDRGDYGSDFDSGYDNDGRQSARSRIRARFARHGQGDADSDNDTSGRSVRFTEGSHQAKERERVLDTEDVAKGPLSGITRLYDSPRVMKRLQESETKKDKPAPPPPQPVKNTYQPPKRPTQTLAQRQVSEEDEITKIKRLMKNAPGEPASAPEPIRPTAERVTALKRSGGGSEEEREDRQQQSSPVSSRSTPSSDHSRKTPAQEIASSDGESDDGSVSSLQRTQRKSTVTPTAATPSRRSSASSDATTAGTRSSAGAGNTSVTQTAPSSTAKNDDDDSDSDSSSETTDSDSSEESDSDDKKSKTVTPKPTMEKTDIGPLLARSANARENSTGSGSNTRKNSRDEGYSSRYGDSSYRSPYAKEESSSYFGRTRPAPEPEPEEKHTSSRYPGGFTSRFLNKSKSSAAVSPEEEEPQRKFSNAGKEEESGYPSSRSRFAALRDKKKSLARSKSSHNFGGDEEDDTEDTTTSPSAYLASKYGTTGNDLSRSRSTHALKSRENSPDRSTTTGSNSEKDGAALSSWARYLKNKYGNRGKDGKDVSSTTTSRRLSLGLPLRSNSTMESSDDDQKNTSGSPTSPTQAMVTPVGFAAVGTRGQYLQKRRQLFKIGSRGSEPGCFTWPRGVAVGPDNSIVVADSSNHRVQVFDCNGNFQKEFGTYGNAEGEFDCLAGVAVNRIGQFIIADRYNHRIQVMDPAGRYLRSFGSQGTSDGRFNYPWGITTDALGFIYVCDKENHRVQVFQSDGTFVGKFGTQGNNKGQLDHPHYIAVSNTNRVIVSDSNNHRVQIFDVNGQVLSSFGSEGSEHGQFKFPRGVAVDDQGYIFVGDSGNNRIQIFQPDGQFLRAFGCWGAGDAEFKGLEGVAVMSNGNILVCDRENHRIQVF